MNICEISTVTHFSHLEFQREEVDFSTLINITYGLPELDSLKIHSLSLSSLQEYLSTEKIIRRFISNKNQITKVCLENLIEIEEVYFLIKLCPRINYLQINCIKNMNVELVVLDILTKINNDNNQNLRTLCFYLPTADNQIVQKLEQIINSNKLLRRYTIKRELGYIYLQWENDYHKDSICPYIKL
jgi:hypothetical protein